MEKQTKEKELRKYAQQLAKRMGVKLDLSKVKDDSLAEVVIALKSGYKGLG